jgi:hypothetical protein
MLTIKLSTLLSIIILILTFISVNLWSPFPLGNLWSTTILQIITLYIIFKNKQRFISRNLSSDIYVKWYLIWVTICIARGFIISENSIEYKQLAIGGIAVLTPVFCRLGYNIYYVQKILSFWYKYAMIFFFLFFYWAVGFTQFYLSPLLLLFCFFPLFPRKKAWIIFSAGILYCILAGEGRSQYLKAIPALLIGLIILLKKTDISYKLIKIGHYIAYLCTFVIFTVILKGLTQNYLGETDPENIIKEYRENSTDTRSLIYIDVIESAISNNYILEGRTPARGNNIVFSGILFEWAYSDNYIFNKGERHINEVMHLNTFTWCGLIGLVLSSLIFFKASYLAVYKSNNIYISLLGCYVAFQWSYGWIENVQQLDILNITLWIMVGMCYSTEFRKMNNQEFKVWIRKLI